MSSGSSALSSLHSLNFPLNVLTANGTSLPIASQGILSTSSFSILGVSHVPRLSKNLFFAQLTDLVVVLSLTLPLVLSRIFTPRLWLGLALGVMTHTAFGSSTGFMLLRCHHFH
jgi:hypothetical protein